MRAAASPAGYPGHGEQTRSCSRFAFDVDDLPSRQFTSTLLLAHNKSGCMVGAPDVPPANLQLGSAAVRIRDHERDDVFVLRFAIVPSCPPPQYPPPSARRWPATRSAPSKPPSGAYFDCGPAAESLTICCNERNSIDFLTASQDRAIVKSPVSNGTLACKSEGAVKCCLNVYIFRLNVCCRTTAVSRATV